MAKKDISKKAAVKAAKKTAAKAPAKTAKKAVRKAARQVAKKAEGRTALAPLPTTDLVAEVAYQKYLERVEKGWPGNEEGDWLAAEEALRVA